VIIEKQCGCVKKSSYEPINRFKTKDEAIKEAEEMCENMNKNFCLKHKFSYEEEQNNIIIKMEINK